MPLMLRSADWSIRINGDEPHPRPHVHVNFRDGSRVSVCIATGCVLAGLVEPHARLKPALRWIALHRALLLVEYRRLNE